MGALILLFFILLHGWQESGQTAISPYTERIQRQFNFYPGGKIQITAGVAGDFKIIGWQRPSVLLEAEKILYQVPSDQAKLLSEQFSIQARWGQTFATIQTVGAPQPGPAVEIHATLYIPKEKTDLNIRLAKGDLAIAAVNGWVEANLEDGSLQAKSLQGYFSLITKQGDLNIEMAGNRWQGSGFTAATYRGSVTLRLPLEYSAALQLETRNGNISIQYPEQMVEGESKPLKAVSQKTGSLLTRSVGQGGAPIKLYTAAGDIHLTSIPAP